MPPLPKARGTKAIGLEQIPIAAWIDDGKQVLMTNQEARQLLSPPRRNSTPVPIERWVRFEPPRSARPARNATYHGEICILCGAHSGKRCAVRSRLLSSRPLRWLNTAGDPHQTWRLELRLAEESAARASAEASLASQQTRAELGRLVAGVAHNLRNPLFGITSTLDALELHLGERALADFFTVLRREAERLNRVVDQLLAFARAGTGKRRESRVASEIIEAAVRRCEVRAREKDVCFAVRAAPDLPLLSLDTEEVVQALTNILENAVFFSPKGSEVSIELEPESRDATPGVRIRIADRGPGFDPELLAHAFEPFVSRRPGGTGLGLAMAARVVQQHGGQMHVANQPAGGGVVELWLPARGSVPDHEGHSTHRR